MARSRSYARLPQLEAQELERVTAVLEVLAGRQTLTQGAQTLNLSRHRFQTLVHRGLGALAQAVSPQAAGRPAKPQELGALQAEVERLRKENAQLKERSGTTERILQVASGLLQGRMRASTRGARQRKTKGAPGEKKPEEPDAVRRAALARADEMNRLGLAAPAAARIAGVHEATIRRWKARARRGEPLALRRTSPSVLPPGPARRAATIVRRLNGLIGADSLRHCVGGLSRRQAACVKAKTLSVMERERKATLTRVTLSVPGIVRGLDGMYLHGANGSVHALFTADAAVPYRTGVRTGPHYDSALVAGAIASDIERNGAPLVYRMDRAKAHDAPAVRELLESHGVLVLHGPPRLPRFYGQHERLNREHRAWADELAELPVDDIQARLEEILFNINSVWRRRTLRWQTASEAWAARPDLHVDRAALREEVRARAAHIARELQHRGGPADLAKRLAIEQALETRGYLRQQLGGWC